MITSEQVLKTYLRLEAETQQAWEALQDPRKACDDVRAWYEAIAAARDEARKGVRFVIKCEYHTTEPQTYGQAMAALGLIEQQRTCPGGHELIAVEKPTSKKRF